MLLPEPSDGLCLAFPWLLGIGFTLVYGCLFIKTWVLYKVWRNAEQFKKTTLTPGFILKLIGFYLGVEIVILIIWSVIDRPKPVFVSILIFSNCLWFFFFLIQNRNGRRFSKSSMQVRAHNLLGHFLSHKRSVAYFWSSSFDPHT